MADVKSEVKPDIKVDPADPDRKLADIEEFEDDTDLQIPPPGQQAWLVKVPKDMWLAWNDIYSQADDEGFEIGKMRVYHGPHDEDPLKRKIQIRLHKNVPQHEGIPKNYNLEIKTADYQNTVVFSEKDLPGHRAIPFGRNNNRLQAGSRPSGIPSKDQRYGNNSRPGYRTAIPKQTALAPMIKHEANAVPIDDAEYQAFLKRSWDKSVHPKSRTTYIEGVDRTLTHPGMSHLNTFSTFGLSSRPSGINKNRPGVKKTPKEKAVRMDRNDLIDALSRCFRRYKYWPMKALRNELRQPEVWIRENLENIAMLVKSGDFALNWVLKPEWQNVVKDSDEVEQGVAKVESATDGEGVMTGDEMGEEDDGDGDLADFEDVKMEGGT